MQLDACVAHTLTAHHSQQPQDQDKAWADLSLEASEVALLVAEGLWDELVADTAQLLTVLDGAAVVAGAGDEA
jgi:hypothetical protein